MGLLATIHSIDVACMRRINRWHAPRWFRWWMIASTRAGDGWLWGAILFALLLDRNYHEALRRALAAGAISITIYMILKRAINRARPGELASRAWARIKPPDRYSFPSGHTLAAFALAFTLLPHLPAYQLPLLFAAASIGASRIFLGVHYPSDVLAGAVLGIFTGSLTRG